jgi:peptide deformylase
MNIENCKITHYPSKVLSSPAQPIDEITDEIRALAEKMIDIMVEQKGIGLAGPQAGMPLRIFVISLDCTKENARVYINPEIKPSGGLEPFEEGCLSLPGISGKIKRYKNCTVTATDIDGHTFTDEADGLYAKALQHEYDHLEGTMIKDRMGQVSKMAIRKRLKELQDNAQ